MTEFGHSEPQPVASEPAADTTAAPERERAPDGTFTAKPADPLVGEALDDAVWKKLTAEGQRALLPGLVNEHPEAPASDGDAQPEAEPATPPVDQALVKSARKHAERLQIPESLLDAMTPAQIAESGKTWAKQVKANDDASRRIADLTKQIEESKAKAPEPVVKAPAQPDVDFDALVQPSVAGFDDETRNSLKGAAKAAADYAIAKITKDLVEPLKAELASAKGDLEAIKQSRGVEVAESIRGELSERLPQLGEDEVWKSVQETFIELAQLPKWKGNPKGALKRAAEIECAGFEPASQVSDSAERGKRNGVASTATQAPRGRGQLTGDALDRAAFYRSLGGKG